ncbi:restriction endonuclease subunit S [Pseudomonas yamanorum]|uniref:methylation-associated defense system restriction endonuclease subunit S MAD5 n=1 Tax=Pseudomonas yamanorum TaxID=515393 RepID=UPI0015A31DBB|nr:restriction endonuclease subunit S [Pseudomonas yamanorum]NWD23210.1 restriction endonuclease subunit S [Pseudomonas yamanorum]
MTFANFKNARIVRSSWLDEGGRRLDCNPYMSGALEARDTLKQLKARKDALITLTGGHTGGIYNGPIFSRVWVDDPRYGVPFLSNSDMLNADLSTLPLLQRRYARSKKLAHLELSPGITLITCSGTIGRMTFVRSDMTGMWSSQHIMKVVPDPNRIPPGYLFAFLSSRYGVPLVVSGTYGAIIQHIEPHHLWKIDIPRFDGATEREVSAHVERASSARTEAARLKQEGIKRFLVEAGLQDISDAPTSKSFSVSTARRSDLVRFDATFFSKHGSEPSDQLADSRLNPVALGACARVFTPGIFKRLYVQGPEWGYAYYSGSELFELAPTARGYLSKRAPGIDDYLIEKDWLLIQDAGQVGGLIGRVTRAGKTVDKSVVSNHLMRIAPASIEDAAFIFAILSSPHGYRAITRHAFGSSIPQLDPKHIGSMLIPWMTDQQRLYIGEPIRESWRLMDLADENEAKARFLVEKAIEEGKY